MDLNSEVVFVGGQRRPSSRFALMTRYARLHGVHRIPCLRRRDRGLAYGGGTGLRRTSRSTPPYGQEGGVDYQVGWQLSWFVACVADRADHCRDSLDEYDEYSAMDGGVHAIEPHIWPC